MEGGRIYHSIDFSYMHKVIVKQTELWNSTQKLAYWKLHPMDQDSMPWRAWLSSARVYKNRESTYFEQGQYYTAESWLTWFWVLALKVV
jgi:hypothetical protein